MAFADGYISVMNVELNIKEMLELGKKAQAAGRGGNLEGDTISIGSRYDVTQGDCNRHLASSVRVAISPSTVFFVLQILLPPCANKQL